MNYSALPVPFLDTLQNQNVDIHPITESCETYPAKLREWETFKELIRQEIGKKHIESHHVTRLLAGEKPLALHPKILSSPNAAAWIYQFCREKDADADVYGRYYTTDWLADFLAGISDLGRFSSPLRLLEPTCGCGNLIQAVLSRLSHFNGTICCYGCDIDAEALHIARIHLPFNHKNKPFRLTMNFQIRNFIYLEAIPVFDLVVLSPPFTDINRLTGDEQKRMKAYNRKIKNTAEYFIMRSFDHTKENGTISFVYPAYLFKKNSLLFSFLASRGIRHNLFHLPIPGNRDVIVGSVIKKNQIEHQEELDDKC